MKEIWKDYDDKYKVSNTGRVINKITNYELKPWIINSGYKQVSVTEGSVLVHRLVAKLFIPSNNTKLNVVNHIDNDKLNNNVDNLEWVDYKGNSLHAIKQGRLNTHTAREQLKKVSSKEIYQKDKQGNIIKVWDSPTQAEKESNGFYSAGKISVVANGHRKYHRDSIWEYVDKTSKRSIGMKINMYGLDGTLLKEKTSIRQIMIFLGMNNHKTLRDKLRETDDFVEYKGYRFKKV